MNKYQEGKEKARQEAIDFQIYCDKADYCYGDLILEQQHFSELAKRYGLIKEFRENGII